MLYTGIKLNIIKGLQEHCGMIVIFVSFFKVKKLIIFYNLYNRHISRNDPQGNKYETYSLCQDLNSIFYNLNKDEK